LPLFAFLKEREKMQTKLFGVEIEKKKDLVKEKAEETHEISMEDLRREQEEAEQEDLRKMIKATNEKGFIVFNEEGKRCFKFWTHLEKTDKVTEDCIFGVHNAGTSKHLPYCVMICDKYGQHAHTYGISKAFGDFLIRELKLIKIEDDGFVKWDNPNCIEKKESDKLVLEKEISECSAKLKELLKKKYKCEVKIVVQKRD